MTELEAIKGLLEYVYYDETSPSCLRWKVSKARRVKIGDVVGHQTNRDWQTSYDKKYLQISRVIWFIFHKELPDTPRVITHSNKDYFDNRLCNLRIVDRGELSLCNLKSRGNFRYLGVSKHREKFQCQIGVNGKSYFLAIYDTEIEAAKAYDKAAMVFHGEHAILNFPEEL